MLRLKRNLHQHSALGSGAFIRLYRRGLRAETRSSKSHSAHDLRRSTELLMLLDSTMATASIRRAFLPIHLATGAMRRREMPKNWRDMPGHLSVSLRRKAIEGPSAQRMSITFNMPMARLTFHSALLVMRMDSFL